MDKAVKADYYDLTAEIDAREVLRYLNDLGIQNISGEVLKYFITDLKKYIQYDLRHKTEAEEQRKEGPERLHSASTFCSRIRSKNQNYATSCARMSNRTTTNKSRHIKGFYSAPNLHQDVVEKPPRRACSCVPVDRKEHNIHLDIKQPAISSNNNLIKVPITKQQKKCDPVSLYHYYLSMWKKYKTNVPGENDWADLRWSIRQKMAVMSDHNIDKKVKKPKSENNGARER